MVTQQKSSNKTSGIVFTPVFRISFPKVFEPEVKKYDDGQEYQEWSCTALFPKTMDQVPTSIPKALRDELAAAMTGEKVLPTLRAAANDVVVAHWPDASSRPRKITSPFRDADSGESCDDGVPPGEKWDGYKGKIFVKFTTKLKPTVVDGTPKAIIDPEEVYGGGWFRAQVRACTYANKKVGVKFILCGLQKVADDDRFGGGSVDPNSFGAIPGFGGASAADDLM